MANNIKELKFIGKFDATLVLDANLPEKDYFKNLANLPIICADGAAIRLSDIGIDFDFVVGDLDTLQKENIRYAADKTIKIEEQDTNDFEKCLKFCLDKNFKNILILGFHGGELEHSLNNWSVFKRFSKIMNLTIFDQQRYCVSVNSSLKTRFNINEIVSIIPQPFAKLRTCGFNWELNGEILELGFREGARNFANQAEQVIEILEGEILLCFDSRGSLSPIFT